MVTIIILALLIYGICARSASVFDLLFVIPLFPRRFGVGKR